MVQWHTHTHRLERFSTSVFTVQKQKMTTHISGVKGQRSRVVSVVEFGEEVSGTRHLGLMEVAHDVSFLLPDVDGFLQLHLALKHTHGFRSNTHTRVTPKNTLAAAVFLTLMTSMSMTRGSVTCLFLSNISRTLSRPWRGVMSSWNMWTETHHTHVSERILPTHSIHFS